MTIEEEINIYMTLMDADELMKQIGLDGFIEELFREKKQRVLTQAEREAVAILTKGWKQ